MSDDRLHIVFALSNCSTAPYFNWFAREAAKHPEVKMSFINLHSERPDMIEDVGQYGWECVWIPFDLDKRKRHMMKVVPKIVKALRQLKPHVFHCHLFDDSVPGLVAARMAGIKMRVITKGDTGFHHFFSPQWQKFDRLNNRNATHIVAISEQCKEFILEHERADQRKIHMIHHGIPLDESTAQDQQIMERIRSEHGLEGKTVIGNVARLIRWKGHHHIIMAARKIVEAHPEVVFLIVGNGDERKNLDIQIKAANLDDHFRFIEWMEPEDIPSVYGTMDLYLHAANHEPFGFVIAEALANGLPVVSTSTGSARDSVVDGVNGYLVPEEDPDAIAAAVMNALDGDHAAMSAQARATAKEKFDFRLMWENHMKLYQSAKS